MYGFLTFLVVVLMIIGLVYTLIKGSQQASVNREERTDNPVGAMAWVYGIATVIVLGGLLYYIFFVRF